MSNDPKDHELVHHGIKGMKWGIRKKSDQSSKKEPLEISSDSMNAMKAKNKLSRKGTQALSNKELQDIITRENLLRQYNRITPAQKSAGSKVYQGIKTTVKYANEAYNMYNSPAGKMMRETIKTVKK